MQTFLPYSDFHASAKVLDWRRLGKQRVEAYQIVRTLISSGQSNGWTHHPAVRMWRGHGLALVAYTLVICDEWIAQGHNDTVRGKVLHEVSEHLHMSPDTLEAMCHQDILSGRAHDVTVRNTELPSWLGREDLHASHRSNLLRKEPAWYGQFGWSEPDDLPYVWPVAPDTPPKSTSTHTPRSKAMPQDSSNSNMNRESLVEALRAKGYDGPVSYTKTRLLEMLDTLTSGGTIATPRRGRRTREGSTDKESTPVA